MWIAVVGFIFIMATLFSIERKLVESNELKKEIIELLKTKKES